MNSASIESWLEKGFQPARTIILASGFDEEIGGDQVSNTTLLRQGVLYGPSLLPLGRQISQ